MKHVLVLSILMAFSPAFLAQNYHLLVGTYTNTGTTWVLRFVWCFIDQAISSVMLPYRWYSKAMLCSFT